MVDTKMLIHNISESSTPLSDWHLLHGAGTLLDPEIHSHMTTPHVLKY